MASDPTTVLIVDDHPAITRAVCMRIATAEGLDTVGVAHSSDEMMDLLDQTVPDVMVVDLFLEDTFGLDLLRTVRTLHEEVEIVVYSMYDDQVYAHRALQAGARAYLTKRHPTEEVVEAIRSAAEEEVYLTRESRKYLLSKMAEGSSGGDNGASISELTDRELAVFQMLGEGCSKGDIAERLNLSPRTVETYRRQAREKLGADSSAEFLRKAVQWTFNR